MSNEKKKSKSWAKIGTIRKGENTKDGSKYSYIKLEKGVDIYVNGEKVPLNDKGVLRLEKPQDTVKKLYERGVISEKQHDERMEKLAELTWLTYEIVAPPNRE